MPAKGAALFLDFDGTLAPIAARPDDVEANPSVCALLRQAAAALENRIAIVSGRSIDAIDLLTEGATICVAGQHGLERRCANGLTHCREARPDVEEAAAVMDMLARARTGLLVERKGASVALHYRLAPGAGEAVIELAERLAGSTGLELQYGRMVVELKTPGPNKGDALRAYMEEKPFSGATPIYIGHEETDEAAFSAAFRLGGFGVLDGDLRPTAASHHLRSPPRVLDWVASGIEHNSFDCGALTWIA